MRALPCAVRGAAAAQHHPAAADAARLGRLLVQSGQRAPASLQLVAVGGAAVGAKLIAGGARARHSGLRGLWPVRGRFGADAQPARRRPRRAAPAAPLPHARLRIARRRRDRDRAAACSAATWASARHAAAVVADRRPRRASMPRASCTCSGRKKHVLITAFGRNVSPEWVETALRSEPAIAQAVVFGDGEPALSAVLWPVRPERIERRCRPLWMPPTPALPDYARVARWVRAQACLQRRVRHGHGQRPAAARGDPATPRRRPRHDGSRRPYRPSHGVLMSFHAQLLEQTADCPHGPARHADHPGLPARRGVAAELPRLPARGLSPRAPHRAAAARLHGRAAERHCVAAPAAGRVHRGGAGPRRMDPRRHPRLRRRRRGGARRAGRASPPK